MPVARLVFFAYLLFFNFTQANQSTNHSVTLLNDKGQIQIGYRSILKRILDAELIEMNFFKFFFKTLFLTKLIDAYTFKATSPNIKISILEIGRAHV